mmetsp:Transcript_22382/g.64325  ORF Transcript_22382/g.64325 Transcript_22382/m.64325 type:complete len:260 (-) Transcript_22382:1482-2261(-)
MVFAARTRTRSGNVGRCGGPGVVEDLLCLDGKVRPLQTPPIRARALEHGVGALLQQPQLALNAVDRQLLGREGDIDGLGCTGDQGHPREADEHDGLPRLLAAPARREDLHRLDAVRQARVSDHHAHRDQRGRANAIDAQGRPAVVKGRVAQAPTHGVPWLDASAPHVLKAVRVRVLYLGASGPRLRGHAGGDEVSGGPRRGAGHAPRGVHLAGQDAREGLAAQGAGIADPNDGAHRVDELLNQNGLACCDNHDDLLRQS